MPSVPIAELKNLPLRAVKTRMDNRSAAAIVAGAA